jgi:farnesyl-diphosphate farnesyltransferase
MKHTKNSSVDILSEYGGNGALDLSDSLLENINHLNKDYSDAQLQSYLLDNVSRTFALTIPALPAPLMHAVSNAYLLCRIVDTVEDEAELSVAQKKKFCSRFINVVGGKESPRKFALELTPLLSDQTPDEEKELIALTDRVITITHQFDERQQQAMERCIRIMAKGMAHYQQNTSTRGLKDLKAMDDYCYYVAGVVGEMLTELFCAYSPEINKNREEMMNRAVSFGQALQMTNILKDVWDDNNRAACWLPRDHFKNGLKNLQQGTSTKTFSEGMQTLVGVAHAHVQDAIDYILLIPSDEKGIRQFCSWAIGMSILTLKNIHKNPGFTDGEQVKISRKSVKATVLLTNMAVGSNFLLKSLFDITRWALPEKEDIKS